MVTYQTQSGFAQIDTFVTSALQRTVAASQLVRARFPVNLLIPIQYTLRSDAPAALVNSVLVQTVVDFINTFDPSITPIDTSAISQLLRDTYPTIGSILPIVITYELLTPTGVVLTYQTADEVIVEASRQIAGPSMALLPLAVSNRTLRYLANTIDVTATQTVVS
jgi:hypothetical protein